MSGGLISSSTSACGQSAESKMMLTVTILQATVSGRECWKCIVDIPMIAIVKSHCRDPVKYGALSEHPAQPRAVYMLPVNERKFTYVCRHLSMFET